MLSISERDVQRILQVDHFRNSHYVHWDINKLLRSYALEFVEQIDKFAGRKPVRKVLDVGTGYGWLAIAFALQGRFEVVAVDPNAARLVAARELAAILGVENRIDWRVGAIESLPFADREFDATYCIEVIEHVGDTPAVLRDLARVTDDLLVISTPNKMFPIVMHDTALPFCHWLPPGISRNVYARAFGRAALQDDNRFWSGRRLLRALPDFHRVSTTLQFPSYRDYRNARRQVDPDNERDSNILRRILEAYYRGVALLGPGAMHMMPNLASTMRRSIA